jgi:hypothetical protein
MVKKIISLVYLVLGTLSIVGHLSFFHQWPGPVRYLFALSIFYYLASLTFTTLIHPIVGIIILVSRHRKQARKTDVAVHLVWSLAIALTWWLMVFVKGYIISV